MILKSVTTHSPEIPDDYFGRFDPSARIFKLRSIGKFRLRQPTFLRGITAELKVLHDYLFCDAEHRDIRPILFESFAQQQSLTFGHCNYRIAVYRPVSFTGNEILQFYAGCPDCHLAVTVSPDDKPLSGTVADCGTADPRNQTDLCKKNPQQLNRWTPRLPELLRRTRSEPASKPHCSPPRESGCKAAAGFATADVRTKSRNWNR